MRKLTSQFLRFIVVGLFGLLVNLTVTYSFTEFMGLWYFWAFIIATFVSWTTIFFANSLLTFVGHEKNKYTQKYTFFIFLYIIAFIFNATLVYIFTSWVGLHYLLSIIISTALTTVITFTFSRNLIFTYGKN
jgi:putative flippase GtrA